MEYGSTRPSMRNMLNELIKEANAYTLMEQHTYGKIKITDEAIMSVPFVSYPGFSLDECMKLHEMSKEVLMLAKQNNDGNEVAITYSLDHQELEQSGEKYKTIVYGTERDVDLMADTDTYHLINTSENVAIINLHNHPTGRSFSINDITLFLVTPSVKLMTVIGNNGNLYYMLKGDEYDRVKAIKLFKKVFDDVIPELKNETVVRFNELTEDEAIVISRRYMREAREVGIEYRSYLSKEMERDEFRG